MQLRCVYARADAPTPARKIGSDSAMCETEPTGDSPRTSDDASSSENDTGALRKAQEREA